jgi:hypothetical protein
VPPEDPTDETLEALHARAVGAIVHAVLGTPREQSQLEALVARNDWIFPEPSPDRPPHQPGPIERRLPLEVTAEHLAEVTATATQWFGKNDAPAAEATRRALELFQVDRAKDWDRKAEIRDQRQLRVVRRKVLDFADSLANSRRCLQELGPDGRARLRELARLDGYVIDDETQDVILLRGGATPNALASLEDLLAEVWVTANAVARSLEPGRATSRRGRRREIARRWLVARLMLVWETFNPGAPLSQPQPRDRTDPEETLRPWPLRDYVELVLKPLGGGGERFLREHLGRRSAADE